MGGGEEINLRQSRSLEDGKRLDNLSEEQLASLDRQVNELIARARQRTAALLRDNRSLLETLRDLLIEKKTIEASALKALAEDKEKPPRRQERQEKKEKQRG